MAIKDGGTCASGTYQGAGSSARTTRRASPNCVLAVKIDSREDGEWADLLIGLLSCWEAAFQRDSCLRLH